MKCQLLLWLYCILIVARFSVRMQKRSDVEPVNPHGDDGFFSLSWASTRVVILSVRRLKVGSPCVLRRFCKSVPGSVCRGVFQYPIANTRYPMSKFFGRRFAGAGFGFSDFAGTHKEHPYKIGIFRLRGRHTGLPLRLVLFCLRFAEVFSTGGLMFCWFCAPLSFSL